VQGDSLAKARTGSGNDDHFPLHISALLGSSTLTEAGVSLSIVQLKVHVFTIAPNKRGALVLVYKLFRNLNKASLTSQSCLIKRNTPMTSAKHSSLTVWIPVLLRDMRSRSVAKKKEEISFRNAKVKGKKEEEAHALKPISPEANAGIH